MEAEAWSSSFPQTHDRKLMVKSELCRRFRRGVCVYGSKCDYAHSVAELRSQPKLCRLFLQNKHCHYGRNCRYLHSTTLPPFNPNPQLLLQPPPESKRMKTSASAPSEGYSSAEHRIMQTSAAAATNASTSTVATSSSHKNEPSYPVKFIFKYNELQKISGIYADWI